MRALRDPDVWLATDLEVIKKLGRLTENGPLTPDQLSGQWSPWRSYAVFHLWSGGTRLMPEIRFSYVTAPFGELLISTDDGVALSRIWPPPAEPRAGWVRDDELPVLAEGRRQLLAYFAGELTTFACRWLPVARPSSARSGTR